MYNKTDWVNYQTLISAEAMNNIEDGIALANTRANHNQVVLNQIKAEAPEELDTFKEVADALGNDPNFAQTIDERINAKADKHDHPYAPTTHTHTKSQITDLPAIVNNLSQTVSGSSLDACQGKILNDKVLNLDANKLDKMVNLSETSLDQDLTVGTYWFFNPTDGFPNGYTTNSDFVLCVYPSSRINVNFQRQVLYDIRSTKVFTRTVSSGVRGEWEQLAFTKDVVNRTTGDGLGYSDGRGLTGDDLLPKYYFKTFTKNGLCIQLFNRAQLDEAGAKLPNGIYHVITTSPWHDCTGGVKQIAIGGSYTSQYVRHSISDAKWGEWKEIATTDKVLCKTYSHGGNVRDYYYTGQYHGIFNKEQLPPQLPSNYDGQGVLTVTTYNEQGGAETGWRELRFQSAHNMGKTYVCTQSNNVWTDWEEVIKTSGLIGKYTPGEYGDGEVFNDYENNQAEWYGHAEGMSTVAGPASHAEGNGCSALGWYAHAEGNGCKVLEYCVAGHAEGNRCIVDGQGSHAEGSQSEATGATSHAEGMMCKATAQGSHAEGASSIASAWYTHAEGVGTVADTYALHAQGCYNKSNSGTTNTYSATNNAFIIGNGTYNNKSNAFRVTYSGATYGLSAFNSTGADYAEYFEWLDGNPDNEDRIGHFVTLEGKKIRFANSEDDYIIGIISGNQSIIGNACEDAWNDMYIRDDFRRLQYEDVEVEKDEYIFDRETGEDKKITSTVIEKHIKLNPNYDPSVEYTPRSERKEWGVVGMLGQIIVKDDGTCRVNGYCKPSKNGIATHTDDKALGFRVIDRLSDNLIEVIMK